jgi:hypothetical protein
MHIPGALMKFPSLALVALAWVSAVACEGTCAARTDEFVIAERGKAAECAVVIPDDAGPSFVYAAEELSRYTEKMTDVKLPVLPRSRYRGGPAVVLASGGGSRRGDWLSDLGCRAFPPGASFYRALRQERA